ncbi:MAG: NADH-ubiquinone oxidoreductase-F iron-sulfur binding region domain-containing protein, partial [Streptomyces sp.]
MTRIRSLMPAPPGSVLGSTPDVAETAETYLATGGYRDVTGPDVLLDHISAAGLRGRGGAGFPA